MWSRTLLLITSIFTTLSVAADGQFLAPWTPGSNKDYSHNAELNTGTRVTFEWTVSYDTANIALTQDNFPGDAQGGPSATINESFTGEVFSWVVSYQGLDPKVNNVYYLSVQNAKDGSDGINSHYFNISGSPLPSSSTTSSSSATPTAATTTTSSHSGDGSGSSAGNEDGRGSSGLSAGDIAGIAIGSAAGAVLLAAALWWLWRSNQKKRQTGNDLHSTQVQFSQDPYKQYHEAAPWNEVYEAPANIASVRYEMGGDGAAQSTAEARQ